MNFIVRSLEDIVFGAFAGVAAAADILNENGGNAVG
jgi:hypothetical protein